MEFSEIKSARLSESYYTARMDNGLAVAVYPMRQKNGVFAMLSARIGSVNRDFMLGGRRVEAPAGVAHFLEHKLFESDGEDAFTLFAATGANANAYTSFERTCYLFSAAINAEESLGILIRFVTHPHFTAETVQKEQGIIAQEIRMYDDNPEWVLSNMMLRSAYVNHPISEDIAGTEESISEITPELLYDCYNAFYRPSNMILSVAGNITSEAVAEICEREYAGYPAPAEKVERIIPSEPETVRRRRSERAMSVFENMFGYIFKEIPFKPAERLKKEAALRLLADVISGDTSELYRRLYDSGLANDLFEASVLAGEDFLSVAFTGESSNPQAVIAEIKAEIERLRQNGIDAERFEECRRAFLGNELCSFDSIESAATKMTVGHFKGCGIYDIIDIIEGLTVADLESALAANLLDKNSAEVFIKPLPDKGGC